MYEQNDLKIKVNKNELLASLKSNREKHASDYQKAKAGFIKLLDKELEKKLQNLRDGKKIELSFDNKKPESYLKEYDDVIGMLELSVDNELTLNHQQYKQYVQNEWDWTRTWSTSNVAYLSAAL
jgi:hypothetical protein